METTSTIRSLSIVRSQAVLQGVCDFAQLSARRARKIQSLEVVRLVAALPFIAECDEPERTAIGHLMTYLAAGSDFGRQYFHHQLSDDNDVMARLRLGMSFKGGNELIIDAGMCRLALVQVYGYIRDQETDLILGKYNPISSGRWIPEEIIPELVRRAEGVDSTELDEILPVSQTPYAWWDH